LPGSNYSKIRFNAIHPNYLGHIEVVYESDIATGVGVGVAGYEHLKL
jgi:hypothetical protein